MRAPRQSAVLTTGRWPAMPRCSFWAVALLVALSVALPGQALLAQGVEAGADTPSDILVVNLTKVRSESLVAKSIERQSAKIGQDLQKGFEERRRALAAEEKALVALRASLDPDAFEARAARFERQVRELKKDRRDQFVALRRTLRNASEKLDQTLRPILAELMAERKASIMIDDRDVVISAVALDVTQIAIKRLDAALPSLEVQWPVENRE